MGNGTVKHALLGNGDRSQNIHYNTKFAKHSSLRKVIFKYYQTPGSNPHIFESQLFFTEKRVLTVWINRL